MQLKVIGSGSTGNAYLLENEQEALLIECGVNIKEIKKAVGFNISKIVGCLVSHEHGDHSKSIKDVMNAGIRVYATTGTFAHLGVDASYQYPFAHHVPRKDTFRAGGFTIKTFPINHDAKDPVGFLINHRETGVVLFLTDTTYSNYTFKGLNNIIIEANYAEEIIDHKLQDKMFLRNRVMESHMSFETCMKFLQANDLNAVNNIVLIHLSDGNSHETDFKETVENTFQKNTHVARNGMAIKFNKTPF